MTPRSDKKGPRRNVARWDPRRNTSQVFAVPPGSGAEAVKALRAWQQRNPAHYDWVADGAPRLTAEQHLERFGVPYKKER